PVNQSSRRYRGFGLAGMRKRKLPNDGAARSGASGSDRVLRSAGIPHRRCVGMYADRLFSIVEMIQSFGDEARSERFLALLPAGLGGAHVLTRFSRLVDFRSHLSIALSGFHQSHRGIGGGRT